MAIQGNVEIKVKDDALLSAASTLKDRISDMRSSYDKVMEIVQKTGGYWIGLAGDAHPFRDRLLCQAELLSYRDQPVRDIH